MEHVVTGTLQLLQYANVPTGVPSQSGRIGRAPSRFFPHFVQTVWISVPLCVTQIHQYMLQLNEKYCETHRSTIPQVLSLGVLPDVRRDVVQAQAREQL